MKKHFKQQVDTIGLAYESLEDESYNSFINECQEAARSGKSIIATALGKNVPICEKFVGTLNSLGIKANFMHANSAIHGDLGIVNEGDLVVLLSKSGETEEIVHLAQLLKSRGSINWLLTCNQKSTASDVLGKKIIMHVESEGDPWNLVPNNSTLVFLVFLQAVCMELIDRLGVELDTFKSNHPGGNIGKILSGE